MDRAVCHPIDLVPPSFIDCRSQGCSIFHEVPRAPFVTPFIEGTPV